MQRLSWPWYPVILAIYPVINLFCVNADVLLAPVIVKPLLLSLTIGLALMAVFSLVFQNISRGALLTGVFLVFSIVIGHFCRALDADDIDLDMLERVYSWLIISGLVFLYIAYKLLRHVRNYESLNMCLNGAAALLLVMPGISWGWHARAQLTLRSYFRQPAMAFVHTAPHNSQPDVYYIILDGYARRDVLQDYFHYQNDGFIKFLRSHGFYVADKSRSNYSYTYLSLASSLNMRYLDDLNASPLQTHNAYTMIQMNSVGQMLRTRGYRWFHFSSGWTVTERAPLADQVFSSRTLDQFSVMLVKTSFLRFCVANFFALDHRQNVLYNLQKLKEIALTPGPKYVFAHFVCPHPPFVFDRHGELPTQSIVLRHLQQIWLPKYRYVDQLDFISRQMETTILRILRDSKTPPIIILQSDHGPACDGLSSHPTAVQIHERTTILNAYFVPWSIRRYLYRSITPVNSFRIIFKQLFNEPMDLLPDKTFYSGPETPYRFMDVTNSEKEWTFKEARYGPSRSDRIHVRRRDPH